MCLSDDLLKCSVPPVDRREHNNDNHTAERSSEIPVSLSINLEPYYLHLRLIPLFFSLLKAAGRNSPVLDHAEVEVRQAFGTECLQQSNNFAIIILFVGFCNLGEGGKNSALVCITQHTVTTR